MSRASVWQPSPELMVQTNLHRFMMEVNRFHSLDLQSYQDLWQWSVEKTTRFWPLIWQYCGVQGSLGDIVAENRQEMARARWFPDSRLNFAENLLRRNDDSPAIIAYNEQGERRELSWQQLESAVASLATWLRAEQVGPGDRVAAYLSNTPETVIAMLATASVGAIWTAIDPQLNEQETLHRLTPLSPVVLFACDPSQQSGQSLTVRDRLISLRQALPSLRHAVSVSRSDDSLPDWTNWQSLLQTAQPSLRFYECAFNDPLYISHRNFQGETVGVIHPVGGSLLQYLKEHQLHCDIRPGDRILCHSKAGEMLWYWQISALASGATLVLYDGGPVHPDNPILWDIARDEQVTLLASHADYFMALEHGSVRPRLTHQLPHLRLVCSSGPRLDNPHCEHLQRFIKTDLQLVQLLECDDIGSCFALCNPISPLFHGESQGRALGMAVQVLDDTGQAVQEGRGWLVCSKPFPAQPLGFWNDPAGERFQAAYFERFAPRWCHGEQVTLTHTGGVLRHRPPTASDQLRLKPLAS